MPYIDEKIKKYEKNIHDEAFKISVMTKDELKLAIDCAAKEGWNPGLYDLEPFYAADPDGFFVGKLNGKPIVFISNVIYGQNLAFWGFFITKEEYRHKGYGIALFKKALEHAGNRVTGADGVVAQLDNYKKAGFDIAYRNLRYEGIAKDKPFEGIVNLKSVPFELLKNYDHKMFLAPRDKFLLEWINMPESFSLGYTKNNQLLGYGVLRKCFKGYKIGPLFADTPEIAENILNGLNSNIVGKTFYLDTPEPNIAALELARKNKMSICFETARVYNGKPPELPLDNIFGVTTFELG